MSSSSSASASSMSAVDNTIDTNNHTPRGEHDNEEGSNDKREREMIVKNDADEDGAPEVQDPNNDNSPHVVGASPQSSTVLPLTSETAEGRRTNQDDSQPEKEKESETSTSHHKSEKKGEERNAHGQGLMDHRDESQLGPSAQRKNSATGDLHEKATVESSASADNKYTEEEEEEEEEEKHRTEKDDADQQKGDHLLHETEKGGAVDEVEAGNQVKHSPRDTHTGASGVDQKKSEGDARITVTSHERKGNDEEEEKKVDKMETSETNIEAQPSSSLSVDEGGAGKVSSTVQKEDKCNTKNGKVDSSLASAYGKERSLEQEAEPSSDPAPTEVKADQSALAAHTIVPSGEGTNEKEVRSTSNNNTNNAHAPKHDHHGTNPSERDAEGAAASVTSNKASRKNSSSRVTAEHSSSSAAPRAEAHAADNQNSDPNRKGGARSPIPALDRSRTPSRGGHLPAAASTSSAEGHHDKSNSVAAISDASYARLMNYSRNSGRLSPSPLPPIHRLTPAQQEKSVQHLYTESIARRQRTLETLEKQHHKSMITYGNRTLSEEETSYITKRLFTDSVAQRQRSLDQRTQKAVERQLRQAGCGKRFDSPEKEKTIVRRLYDTIEKDREINQKLFEKHNPQRKKVVRSPERIHENDRRFYEGQFAKRE